MATEPFPVEFPSAEDEEAAGALTPDECPEGRFEVEREVLLWCWSPVSIRSGEKLHPRVGMARGGEVLNRGPV